MQVDNLKYSLLDKLISVEDNGLLRKINDLIGDVDLEDKELKLSDTQRKMLLDSEEDIRNGKIILDEDLNAEEEIWLKK
jgi:hypothetical protein